MKSHLWQLLTKKSGSTVERLRSTLPTPWAPSIRLRTCSERHTAVSASNGSRRPGLEATVSNIARRGL